MAQTRFVEAAPRCVFRPPLKTASFEGQGTLEFSQFFKCERANFHNFGFVRFAWDKHSNNSDPEISKNKYVDILNRAKLRL